MSGSWYSSAAGRTLDVSRYNNVYPVSISIDGRSTVYTKEEGVQIANAILAQCGQAPRVASRSGRSAFAQ